MDERIVIVGAGSVGCFVGGLWRNAGLDVAFIARPAIAAEIAANGMRLTDCDGGDIRLQSAGLDVSTDPERLSEAGLVVLAVKSPATRDAAADITRHAPPAVPVLSLQNGISNVDVLTEAMPDRTILRGMVGFNVAHIGDGHWHRGTSGALVAQDHPLLDPIVAATAAGTVPLERAGNMLEIAWGKLLLNLNNAVNALSGLPLLDELSQRPYRRVLAASIREALHVLRAAGIAPARIGPLPPAMLPGFLALPDVIFRPVGLRLQKIDADARSSMADDFAAGRPTEIDVLNGEIVRLAERNGIDVPVNRRIVELVHEAEHGARRNWSGAALLAEITTRT